MSKKSIDARMSMFGRLAMESGLVTYDDIVACIEEQEKTRTETGSAPKLGEILVQRGILTNAEVDMILKMQANPGGLIGRQLMERGLVTRAQLRRALDEQAELTHAGIQPPRIGELLIEKGIIKREDLDKILRKKVEPAVSLFGEFLVAKKLVKKDDIDLCLAQQKEVAESGGKVPKLGELLVANGVLRKEQMELYNLRHAQERRQVLPALQSSATKVVAARKSVHRTVGDYELIDNLGQHVDGVTFRAMHTPSGAMVIVHHFTPPASTSAASAIAKIGTGTGFQVRTAPNVKSARLTDKSPAAAGSLRPDAAQKPLEPTEEVAVEEIHAVDGFAQKVEAVMQIHGTANQTVFSSDDVGEHRAVVADYIEGITLDRVLADKEKIDWAWAAEILHDLAGVLAQAEALGISHDDVRPGSIFIDAAGKAHLGLWCYTRDPVVNRDWLGKKNRNIPFYFAPERLTDGPGIKCDMFSLGVTIIHALTGTAPMRGSETAEVLTRYNPGTLMQDLAMDMSLPMEFLTLISQMVEERPANRPESFLHIQDTLALLGERENLDFTTPVTGNAIRRQMNLQEAKAVLGRFLVSDMPSREHRKIHFSQLLKYFLVPLVAMAVIMATVTLVYQNTQASHGLMVRGRWLDQHGDKGGALNLFRMISTLYPNSEAVQKRYYDLAMEMRDHGEAELALEKMMRLHPDKTAEYREQQGDLQVWQRRYASAADVYRELLNRRPNDIKLRHKLASALLWAHDYPKAKEEFQELVKVEPNNPANLLGLARAAAGSNDSEAAARTFKRLFDMNVLPESTVMEYGWILSNLGRTDELKGMAQTALSRNESVEYTPKNLTTLNFWAGDYRKAKGILDSAAGPAGNDRESILFRISVNQHLGDTQDVINDYRRLAEIDPQNDSYLLTIAHLYQGEKNFTKANEILQELLGKDDKNVELYREIAENYTYMNNLSEAIHWYKELLKRAPGDKETVDKMVQAMLWNENYDEAGKYVEKAYQENPGDRDAQVNLALVYSRLGKEREALQLVNKLLAENALKEEERERIAMNALSSNSNDLLFRVIGDSALNTQKVTEMRLMLARRLRAQGKHALALPFYAAVLSVTPQPDPALLMEMAETANWAKRPDIATRWLEMARDIVATREGRGGGAGAKSYLLSSKDWDSLLDPLNQQPVVRDSLVGFQRQFSFDALKQQQVRKN